MQGLVDVDGKSINSFIPVREDSVRSYNYKKKLDQATSTAPDDSETKRLRKVWNAYVEMREAYYGSEASGAQFSIIDVSQFLDVEADEEEDTAVKSNKTGHRKQHRSTIRSYFDTPGTVGQPMNRRDSPIDADAYDEDDGFCVGDDHVDEEEKLPSLSDMSPKDIEELHEMKRRKLNSIEEELIFKKEELKALLKDIAEHEASLLNVTDELDTLSRILSLCNTSM